MSLVPEFELGLWNAWIIVIWDFLTFPILTRVMKHKFPDEDGDFAALPGGLKGLLIGSKVVIFVAMIYSIFLPLKVGTTWFCVGFPIAVIGLIGSWVVTANWVMTPIDVPVTRGLYRFSRHPMYVTAIILFLGVAIATASWVLFVLAAVFIIGCVVGVDLEEEFVLKKYGDAYREYMDRTPRWIGIPKK